MSKYLAWKVFEREVVKFFEGLGLRAKRNWERQFIEKDGVDVIAEGGGRRFIIQCKYSKKELPSLVRAWREVLNGKGYKDIPLVVVRGGMDVEGQLATQSLVLMSWSDFRRLMEGLGKNDIVVKEGLKVSKEVS